MTGTMKTNVIAGQGTFQSTGKTAVEEKTADKLSEYRAAAEKAAAEKAAAEKAAAEKAAAEKAAAEKAAAEKKSGKKEKVEKVKAEIVTGAEAEKGKGVKSKELALQELELLSSHIREELDGVAKSFCRIGFDLWKIKEGKLYEQAGFKNISEYGESAFNLKKSSTANYIKVCERFSKQDNGKPTAQLAENFQCFSYTQLTETLLLPEEKASQVTPEMTVKEIRKLKAGNEGESSASTPSVSSSQEPRDACHPTELFSGVITINNWDKVLGIIKKHFGGEFTIYLEH